MKPSNENPQFSHEGVRDEFIIETNIICEHSMIVVFYCNRNKNNHRLFLHTNSRFLEIATVLFGQDPTTRKIRKNLIYHT